MRTPIQATLLRPLKRTLAFLAAGLCMSLPGIQAATTTADTGRQATPEVMEQGPMHEAFASVILANPEPGPVVGVEPPPMVEELPPEEMPEGDHIEWIGGYWAWDDDNARYIWVSGAWRQAPQGREWVAGYWIKCEGGYQWISGYWAVGNAPAAEPAYLPKPPASIEYGYTTVAPSPEYVWVPGCWVWRGRYVWSPGYWVAGRADSCWIPATYVWTPHGYVYVDGYWDYAFEERGVLFAPVYWEPAPEVVYVREVHRYSPVVVINLFYASDCLFVRPRYHHYYYGNYYAPRWRSSGFYVSFSWNSRSGGCEPISNHRRWVHRDDRDWDRRQKESYAERSSGRQPVSPVRATSVKAATVPGSSSLVAGQQERKTKRLDSVEREKLAKQSRQPVASHTKKSVSYATSENQRGTEKTQAKEVREKGKVKEKESAVSRSSYAPETKQSYPVRSGAQPVVKQERREQVVQSGTWKQKPEALREPQESYRKRETIPYSQDRKSSKSYATPGSTSGKESGRQDGRWKSPR